MLPRLIKSFLPAFLLLPSISMTAQNVHKCGQYEAEEELVKMFPQSKNEVEKSRKELEAFTAKFNSLRRGSASTNATKYVIPVVFHVLHQNGPENISDAQIHDAMRILNEDFSDDKNPRLVDVISQFQPVIGHPNIEFRLAKKDPSGNATTGIVRVVTSETNVGNQNSKLQSYWPRSKYLNIWVTKAIMGNSTNFGILAYSQVPSSVDPSHMAPYDGVIVKQQFVGSIGTSVNTNASTLTHEVGHYLNLIHPWGHSNQPEVASNCNIDDGVSDTPNTVGTASGCNTSKTTCGSLDNVQNFMDYASCELMFTKGQVNRMLATLNSSVAQRNNLWSQGNLDATGVNGLFEANFKTKRYNACASDPIAFTDESRYSANKWSWSFQGGVPATSTTQNPSVVYHQPGLYNVKLDVSKAGINKSASKSSYVFVSSRLGKAVPASDNFSGLNALPDNNWYAYNKDGDSYQFKLNTNNGFNGGKCVQMENFGNQKVTVDELLSTTYDLSTLTSGKVSFKYAYKRAHPVDKEKLTLYISNDCGGTWKSIWTQSAGSLANVSGFGGAFIPTATHQWKTVDVTLTSAQFSEGAQFKFVFNGNKGNNLFIDDFNVSGTLSNVAKLYYPENNSVGRANNTKLIWKKMTNASSYEYQLDTDQNFGSSGLKTGVVNTNQLQPSSALTNGQTYYWRVRLIVGGAAQPWSATWKFKVSPNGVSVQELLRERMNLKVYPNPANENTVVSFETEKEEEVSLYLVDITGRVKTWFEKRNLSQGKHLFNLSDLQLNNGVYTVLVKVGERSITERLVIK